MLDSRNELRVSYETVLVRNWVWSRGDGGDSWFCCCNCRLGGVVTLGVYDDKYWDWESGTGAAKGCGASGLTPLRDEVRRARVSSGEEC